MVWWGSLLLTLPSIVCKVACAGSKVSSGKVSMASHISSNNARFKGDNPG